ncbi:Spore coat protein SA [Burkholderiales bacterium]|nr:Spore coat protein SA [Burkholderiales bacterium]
MRKVLYFHYQRSKRDGSFVHTREFEAAFGGLCREQGIGFAVYAPPAIDPEEGRPTVLGRLRQTLAQWYLRDFKVLLAQWRAMFREREILRRERPDVVLTRFDDTTLSILWACRSEAIPVVLEINAPIKDELDDAYRQLPWFKNLYSNQHALALAGGAFTVSEEISAPLRVGLSPAKPVWTIPNGVDISRFDPSISGDALRARYGIGPDRVVLGFVGSFAPWHGLDFLADAFDTLLAEQLPVHLLLVGQANARWQPLIDRLRAARVGEHVTMAGFVKPVDIPPLLAAMDITVLPNAARYCSPLKLFEYMAMAKPTVAAATPPVAATLVHGVEGLLFEPGDRGAFTVELRRLVLDRSLREDLGAAARRRMMHEFTWRHNAERVLELLQSVLAQASAKPGS